MMNNKAPVAKVAAEVPPRTKPSNYPEPFASRMAQREKRALADFFGLKNFGVNLTRIAPGGESALMHTHSKRDELIYILEGEAVLATPSGETPLSVGMCAGFPAGGTANHVLNRSDRDLVTLEIGDRAEGDEGSYPQDDTHAVMGADGKWRFTRKDGLP
ncbi:MAG: cupin domain-containing protein [Rhodobacteraceae bacterium]|nr:cupin domain-containing protein [Paracoccaceae bacterium]